MVDEYGDGSLGGVFWNGHFHWIRVYYLVYFHVEEQVVKVMSLPMIQYTWKMVN